MSQCTPKNNSDQTCSCPSTIQGSPETPRTSQHYHIKELCTILTAEHAGAGADAPEAVAPVAVLLPPGPVLALQFAALACQTNNYIAKYIL